ncbi:hypothetical protein ACF0H5_009765 [Mactra antiquata]
MKIVTILFTVSILVSMYVHGSNDQLKERRTALKSLKAYKSQSKEARERNEKLEKENEHLLRVAERLLGGNKGEFLGELRELDLVKKSVTDPFCDMTIDCSDDSNLNIVDGEEYRTIDGQCNNKAEFSWGMTNVQHLRIVDQAYQNSQWAPRNRSVDPTTRREPLPNPRNISNVVHKTTSDKADTTDGHTLALFYFMQFIDHDIILTPDGNVGNGRDCCGGDGGFCLTIFVTEEDDFFEHGHCMELARSDTVFPCDDDSGFQNQYNGVTAYIDASMIYGSTSDEMNLLRTGIGGYLKESTNRFMPESEDAEDLPCDETSPYLCFEAGDTRANVHPGLTSYHTIFVREHNRIVEELGSLHTDWSDDKLYMEGRKIVSAQIQHIVYNEMLPAVLDSAYLSKYKLQLSDAYTYNASLDASIIQVFSFAYRFHHLMPSHLHMTELDGDKYETSMTSEQYEVYEKPSYLLNEDYHGLDKIALGFAYNSCPMTNGRMNDDARDRLFFKNATDTFDLAAINIVRGREWGTPSYTKYRELCGQGTASDWDDLSNTHTADEIELLKSVYLVPDDIDIWTGLITETKVGTSLSGPTQSCLIGMQFENFKFGDRFWYEDSTYGYSDDKLEEIQKVTLAKILCDNLNLSTMREKVFDSSSDMKSCSAIADWSLGVF